MRTLRERQGSAGTITQWRNGGHGYVPDIKSEGIVHLTMENVKSLSIFTSYNWKVKTLDNLNTKYRAERNLLLETENFGHWCQRANVRQICSDQRTVGPLLLSTSINLSCYLNKMVLLLPGSSPDCLCMFYILDTILLIWEDGHGSKLGLLSVKHTW